MANSEKPTPAPAPKATEEAVAASSETTSCEATPTENAPSDGEWKALQDELAVLRQEKADREAAREFAALFPDERMDALPDEVLREAKEKSLPLTAAFALYWRREQLKAEAAAAATAKAAEKSIGGIGEAGNPQNGEFTVAEIAAMSRADIRRHYKDVIRSLGNHSFISSTK